MSVHQRVLCAAMLSFLLGPMAACSADDQVGPGTGTAVPSQQLGVEPSAASLLIGETLQFRATGALVVNGVGIYGTSWTSSDPAVIQVSPTGMATATGVGSAHVTASRLGVIATARVSVSARR